MEHPKADTASPQIWAAPQIEILQFIVGRKVSRVLCGLGSRRLQAVCDRDNYLARIRRSEVSGDLTGKGHSCARGLDGDLGTVPTTCWYQRAHGPSDSEIKP
jgi:hypothetical protein